MHIDSQDQTETLESGSLSRVVSNPDLDNHTLRPLQLYVSGKLNLDLFQRSWSRIVVRGFEDLQSQGPGRITLREKRHERFNFRRPTAQILDENVLEVTCFPGRDYVRHYAMLISMHLKFMGKSSVNVECIQPSPEMCINIFMRSNLQSLGEIDTVVVGYVELLDKLVDDSWESGPDDVGDKIFAWQKRNRAGCRIAYLGCLFSFWGDISGHLVRALQVLNKIKCIIYLGKTGSLRTHDKPNEVLATGDSTLLDGKELKWKNVFEDALLQLKRPEVACGTHITVPSPLDESEAWLQQWKHKYSWVDCEVGYMVQACQTLTAQNTAFGYLHIVSDNVALEHTDNLMNEELTSIITKRKRLLSTVQDILSCYLEQDLAETLN